MIKGKPECGSARGKVNRRDVQWNGEFLCRRNLRNVVLVKKGRRVAFAGSRGTGVKDKRTNSDNRQCDFVVADKFV